MVSLTRALIAAVAGGVAHFFSGFLVYGVALADVMVGMLTTAGASVARPKDGMVFPAMLVGSLMAGLLLSVLLNRYLATRSAKRGMEVGFVLFALFSTFYDAYLYATADVYRLPGLLVDVAACAVTGAATGAVVGWVSGSDVDAATKKR